MEQTETETKKRGKSTGDKLSPVENDSAGWKKATDRRCQHRATALIMDSRDKEVLNMQFTLIPILAKAWNKSYSDLSDMFTKYDVPGYIDVCYEKYNSTGNQGIIDDLKEYIEMQGGSIGK